MSDSCGRSSSAFLSSPFHACPQTCKACIANGNGLNTRTSSTASQNAASESPHFEAQLSHDGGVSAMYNHGLAQVAQLLAGFGPALVPVASSEVLYQAGSCHFETLLVPTVCL